MKRISREIYIPNPDEPHQVFEMGERSLHRGANPVLLRIPFLLPNGKKRAAAAAFVENTIIYSLAPALPFQGVIGIPFIAEDRALVTRNKVFSLGGIVWRGGREPHTPNDARTLVNADVSLVPEVSLLPLFGRRRVPILLRTLRGIIARLTLFPNRIHYRGIHDGPSPENESFFIDLPEHLSENCFENARFDQSFPEPPDGGIIGYIRVEGNPHKSLKTQSVNERILKGGIAQIVQILKDQALQRHNDRHRRISPLRGLVQRFAHALERFKINTLIDLSKHGVRSALLGPPVEHAI